MSRERLSSRAEHRIHFPEVKVKKKSGVMGDFVIAVELGDMCESGSSLDGNVHAASTQSNHCPPLLSSLHF